MNYVIISKDHPRETKLSGLGVQKFHLYVVAFLLSSQLWCVKSKKYLQFFSPLVMCGFTTSLE